MFVDSVRVIQNSGCKRPGLGALCQDINMKINIHSAFEDVDILMTICNKKSKILHHSDQKLPIPIRMVYTLVAECTSCQEFTTLRVHCGKYSIKFESNL